MTWPLVTVMTTEIVPDLGDAVFACWVMLWTGGQLGRFLRGDWSALAEFWNGNIFYPERSTIAYAEHLTPQMLQAMPIFAATGNIVLAYNLVFFATFVMCGLGMYLLVREVTGRPWPALLAGVAFAFAPYRMDQFPHIQVVSTQWMPLALYGFRRYFVTGRLRPLIGAAVSVALQALSCAYFLLFFVPFAAAYCAYEMISRRELLNRRTWLHLGSAWAGAFAITAPFVWPYMNVQRGLDVGVRPLKEVISYSADIWAFVTAPPSLRLWGERLTLFPKPEGSGFPGLVILVFVAFGIGSVVLKRVRGKEPTPALFGFSLAALAASAVLALGPQIEWHGRAIGSGPYLWLYQHVPGFTGVRVPARFLTITTLFAAMLAGIGAAAVTARWRRAGAAIVAIGIVGILAESWSAPIGTNQRLFVEHFDLAPRHLASASTLGAVYEAVRDLPNPAVLAEFPFGAPPFDIQTVFYAGFHRKPVINGFSGFFPASFNERFETLGWDPTEREVEALATLRSANVTHVVVHEAAYLDEKGPRISDWLRRVGAREVVAHGTDRLFAMK